MVDKYNHSLAAKGQRAVNQLLEDHTIVGHVKISLGQFREQILPHLADPNNRNISYWLEYVKHPSAELYVMEDDDVTVKYVIPPLTGSVVTTIPVIGRHALDGRLVTAVKKIERSPRSAQKEFDSVLTVTPAKNIIANRIKLNNILVQEGYPPLPIPGTPSGFTGVSATGPAKDNTSVKVDYTDEFDEL